MYRPVVVTVALTALVAAVSLSWVEVRQEREFRRLIAAGDAAVSRQNTSDAIELFSGAIAYRDDSMLAYLKRGDTYRRRGDLVAAARDLRRAAELDPSAPRPVELLGDVQAALGRDDLAIVQYRRYVELDDTVPAVLYKLGLAHYRAGQVAAAAEALQRAIALDDKLQQAHYALGMVYRRQNRVADALTALNRALALDATLTPARLELADLLAAVGRPVDGIEQLEALAALEPRRPEWLIGVGQAFTRINRHEDAILTLTRAAERHPGSALILTALGEAWLALAESGTDLDVPAVARAIGVLRPVATRSDATTGTLTQYGRALLMSGDARAAEPVLQLAVSRLPVQPVAFRYLAEAADRLGHAAVAGEARSSYDRLTLPSALPDPARREDRRREN